MWLRHVFPIAACRSASSILQFLAYGLVNYSRSPKSLSITACSAFARSFFFFTFLYIYFVLMGERDGNNFTVARLPSDLWRSQDAGWTYPREKRTFGARERYLYISGYDINDADDATGARTQCGLTKSPGSFSARLMQETRGEAGIAELGSRCRH